LLITRLGCGLGQAGAYPTSASIISKWVPFRRRGTSSAIVALGGRCGGAIAPVLTAFLIVSFVPADAPVELQPADLLNGPRLCAQIAPAEADEPVSEIPSAGVRVWTLLTVAEQAVFADEAQRFRTLESEVDDDNQAAETLAGRRLTDTNEATVLAALNRLLADPNLYTELDFRSVRLPREALRFLKRRGQGEAPDERESRRFNRFVLEGSFPREIGKLYTQGWRPVMYVYGAAGLFVAALFWIVFRNRPEEHPWCNAQERDLIAADRPAGAPSPHGKPGMVPLKRLLQSRSMWLDCFLQLGTNIGWVFLVTWLPRYLIDVHQVPILER
ncbi:unnamed protein product, partial [marine sediment metagenome]